MAAVKGPIIWQDLSTPADTSLTAMSEQIFSSRCHAEQAIGHADRKPLSHADARRCSNQAIGGAGRDRTDDPLLAKQVLSQLSYGP